jgi:hypothetical protein
MEHLRKPVHDWARGGFIVSDPDLSKLDLTGYSCIIWTRSVFKCPNP